MSQVFRCDVCGKVPDPEGEVTYATKLEVTANHRNFNLAQVRLECCASCSNELYNGIEKLRDTIDLGWRQREIKISERSLRSSLHLDQKP